MRTALSFLNKTVNHPNQKGSVLCGFCRQQTDRVRHPKAEFFGNL